MEMRGNRTHNLRENSKCGSASEIFEAILEDLLAFNAPSDDVSVVVIKRS